MKKAIFIVILIILIVLGGGIYLVATEKISLPFLEKLSEKVLQKAMEKFFNLQSYSFITEGNLIIKLSTMPFSLPLFPTEGQPPQQSEKQTESKIRVKINGQGNLKDKNEPKISMLIDGSYITEGLTMDFSLETRGIGKKSYLYLKTAPSLPFLDIFIQPFKKKWVLLETKETPDQEKKMTLEKTQEILAKLKETIKEKPIWKVKSKLKAESINNVLCYHYEIAFDKEVARDIYLEIFKSLVNKEPEQKDLEQINKFLETLEKMDVEIWVGKKDYYPRKFYLKGNFEQENVKINFEATSLFSDFNRDLKIEEPAGAKTFEEIMKETMKLPEGLGLELPSLEELKEGRGERITVDRLGTIGKMQTGLELYFQDHKVYPLNIKEAERVLIDVSLKADLGFEGFSVPADFPYIYLPINNPPDDYLLIAILEEAVTLRGIEGQGRFLIAPSGQASGGIVADYLFKLKDIPIIDSDNDKLIDWLEEILGTDKNNPDSDGDGYLDGQELANGYNPLGVGLLKPLTIEIKNKILAE